MSNRSPGHTVSRPSGEHAFVPTPLVEMLHSITSRAPDQASFDLATLFSLWEGLTNRLTWVP